MLDVQSRWAQLHNTMPALRLYALVDGVQYQTQLCKRFQPGSGLFPLFAGTPDSALAHAGPLAGGRGHCRRCDGRRAGHA
jgi:hypothetical protein